MQSKLNIPNDINIFNIGVCFSSEYLLFINDVVFIELIIKFTNIYIHIFDCLHIFFCSTYDVSHKDIIANTKYTIDAITKENINNTIIQIKNVLHILFVRVDFLIKELISSVELIIDCLFVQYKKLFNFLY